MARVGNKRKTKVKEWNPETPAEKIKSGLLPEQDELWKDRTENQVKIKLKPLLGQDKAS